MKRSAYKRYAFHRLAAEALPCDLVRDDLYLRVSTTRMAKLSRQIGISLEDLTEACALLVVPIPPYEYWAARDRGTPYAMPALPPYSGPVVYRTTSATPASIREIINAPRCPTVLSVQDVEILTGRKTVRLQISQLTAMQIPFALSGSGHPMVPVAAIEGKKAISKQVLEGISERTSRSLVGENGRARLRAG